MFFLQNPNTTEDLFPNSYFCLNLKCYLSRATKSLWWLNSRLKGHLLRGAFPVTLTIGVVPSLIFLFVNSCLLWNFCFDLLLVSSKSGFVCLLSILFPDESLAPRIIGAQKTFVEKTNGMVLRQDQNDKLS